MTMSETEILEILRELRLTEAEWQTLTILCDIETDPAGCGMTTPERKREWMRENKDTLDMLNLAGLVRRGSVCDGETGEVEWLDSCFSTETGEWAASAVNMIFDWDTFTWAAGSEEGPAEGSESPLNLAAGVDGGIHFV